MLEIPDIFLGCKADAGSEPTYAEKNESTPLGVHTASSTFLHSQLNLFILFLCLNCGVYDTISPKDFIYFF